MIEAFSHRLALKMKEINPEQTASVEVMTFALQGLLQNTISIVLAILVGVVFGYPWETFIVVISFMGLRFISGGFHFRSALLCLIFSASVFIIIPLIHVNELALLIVNSVSALLVALFAPANVKEHIRFSERYFIVFKFLSVLLVAINFFFLHPVVTLAFIAQAVTLIPFRKEVNNA